MENETSDVQPTCQGPLQLLSPPFLMTSTTKQMRPNGKPQKAQDVNDLRRHSVWCVNWCVTERYWRWHWSVAQTSPCLHSNDRTTVLIFTVT